MMWSQWCEQAVGSQCVDAGGGRWGEGEDRLGPDWLDFGQICGWQCWRRCGSFGQPILNHQGSQHLDILENHICTRGGYVRETHTHIYKHTLTAYLIPSSLLLHAHTLTHSHLLKDTQNGPRRKLNCTCFIIWAVQCFSQAPSSVMV